MAARLGAYVNSIHIKNINIILQTYEFYTFYKRPNGEKKNRETQVFRRMSQKHKSNRSKKKVFSDTYVRKTNNEYKKNKINTYFSM